jgi:hypothetical protein|tara:strand:- start:1073 stop:1306 length:234 start_codon:yes stop_codon:yes gene_type:complete
MSEEVPELPEMPERREAPRNCTSCGHSVVCKAFEASAMLVKTMEKFDFLKYPLKAEDIAIGCSQYLPIIPTKQEFGR